MSARAATAVIADDSSDARFLVSAALLDTGVVEIVAEVADGVAAVAAVDRYHPDLVVLDVAMPAMDGLEAAGVIRSMDPLVKIVVASAFAASRVGDEAIRAGADRYVDKAHLHVELADAVAALLPDHRPVTSPVRRSQRGPIHPPEPTSALDLVLDAVEEAVIVVSGSRGSVMRANFSARQLFDLSSADLLTSTVESLRLGDEVGGAVDAALPHSRIPVEIESGGSTRHLSVSVRPTRIGVSTSEIVITAVDVTELHHALDAKQATLDSLPAMAILRYNEQFCITASAGQALEARGYDAASLRGDNILERLPPELAEALRPAYQAPLDGDRVVIDAQPGVDGTVWHVQFVPVETGTAERHGLVISTEVTRFVHPVQPVDT